MIPPSEQRRILVLGYLVRGPLGGLAWHHLQYVLGLARMGHDVYFLEDSDDYESCYDPVQDQMTRDPGYGLRFADRCFQRLELAGRWAYHDAATGSWHGPLGERVVRLCESADLLLNLSAVNPLRPWCLAIPHRALVDTDPVFTQIRHLTDSVAFGRAKQHTSFHTFGENFGQAECTIPDDGLPWQPTRQPVVLDAWPRTPAPADGKWTTVMQWESYPSREYQGQVYEMKSASFAPYLTLPSRTSERLELALGSRSAPREHLAAAGWSLVDSREPTRDPWTYQDYLRRSKAEFSVAKQGYVVSRSGWFSERSAAYLASGRPVVVQDTGFTHWLPAGDGVLHFRSPDEALNQMQSVDADYARHCRAARAVAAEYFAHDCVLETLLRQTEACPADLPAVPDSRSID